MDLLTALLQVIEIASEGIHLVNEDGVTVIYNKAASEFDGLSPDEVIGRHLLDVFPSLTHDSSTLLRILKSGVPEIAKQQTFSNYKGKTITTINSTHPVKLDGRITGACEISTDITRIKEMAERITDLRTELRDKGEASRRPVSRARQAKESPAHTLYTIEGIIGESSVMKEVKGRIFQVAQGSSNIIVWGETGTGKELAVQSIHSASDRAGAPFVPQNCAALPETLLESLVFGTSRGGFTGAQDRPGLLELASGGTLYLDEIDSMPLGLQAKLLRVIQEKRVRRLGDLKERPVDVRIIGSASVPPRQAVKDGLLRADLYFRLAVVEIPLPPLRKRREDIPLLCSHFLEKHSGYPGHPGITISPKVMSAFLTYDWPGNVRELEHAIEGSLAFAQDKVIELDHIPWSVRGVTAATWTFKSQEGLIHTPLPRASQPRHLEDAESLEGSEVSGERKDSTSPKDSTKPKGLRAPVGLAGPEGFSEPSEQGNFEQLKGTEESRSTKQESLRNELREKEKQAIEDALDEGKTVSQAARILGLPRQTLQYRMKVLGILGVRNRKS